MVKMTNHGSGRVRMEFRVPSRGLIGLRSRDAHRDARHHRDELALRRLHPLPGRDSAAAHRRAHRRPRRAPPPPTRSTACRTAACCFVSAGIEVYEGMVVGEHSRDNDLDVNAVREKKLTNMRASSADEAIRLVPVQGAQPRAGHRVHRRRRAGRGHAEVAAPAQEDPAGQPPPQAQRAAGSAITGKHPRHLDRAEWRDLLLLSV